MRVDQFDFELPEDRIALRPAEPRDSARMLVVWPEGKRESASVRDLPRFLKSGDICVVNDTRVIPARLFGHRLAREEGVDARVEVTLHKRTAADRYLAFARPGKRLRAGDKLHLGTNLDAELVSKGDGGEVEIRFAIAGAALDVAIAEQGEVPLPPYIASKRPADMRDRSDYQTVYARDGNSVAAPTAGLHFTPSLLQSLETKGVGIHRVTLEVGAGTFLPVSVEDTADHKMHAERAILSAPVAEALNEARAAGHRILAVGTTALRTLETAVDENGRFHAYEGDTSIFITPGYPVKGADILLTNFHLPRSTLFMLVCAFAGIKTMKDAYEAAIRDHYRFYSYGDASLLFRSTP